MGWTGCPRGSSLLDIDSVAPAADRSIGVPTGMRHRRRASRACTLAFLVLQAFIPGSLGRSNNMLPLRGPRRSLQQLQQEPDYYSKLVTLSSSVHGEVVKRGPIPASRYDDMHFNHTPFREWLLRTTLHGEQVPGPQPPAYKCGVFVNHHYKIIFIRNRKAASTTVLDTFKVACKSQSRLFCLKHFSHEELASWNITNEEMWMKYYVVSSTRNPWARAASGYDYVQDRWPNKEGVCANPSFSTFCKDPNYLGKLGNLFRCGATKSFRGDDAWAYDFYHIEPAYHCMTDAAGQIAVDFLIRYEHLEEDFLQLIDLLNKRRDPALPEIPTGKMRWMKKGVFVKEAAEATDQDLAAMAAAVSADRHAAKYRACGMECVNNLAAFFKADLDLMQLQVPPGDVRAPRVGTMLAGGG